MAKQTVQFEININSKKGETTLKSLSKGFDDITIKSKQAGQAAQQLGIKLKDLQTQGATLSTSSKAFQGLGTSISGVSAASGGATASVLELGRAISDAPYGIRGVANNLSQLASNLVFTTKAAGGFGNAIKALGKELMGPLGLLLAIQAVIAALDYFSQQSKEAEKSTKSIGESVGEAASNFKILLRAQQDNTLGMEEARESVKRINSQYKDLNVSLDENGKLTDESVKAIERKIQRLEDLAKAQAIQAIVEEKYGEVILKTIEIEEANAKLNQKITEATALRVKADKDAAEGAVSRNNRVEQAAIGAEKSVDFMINKVKELTKDRGDMQAEITKLIQMIPNIGDLFKIDTKGVGSANRTFKQQLLNLEKFINQQYKKEFSLREVNQVKLLEKQQDFEEKDLEIRYRAFLDRQELRYNDFMSSNASEEAKAEATLRYNESVELAEEEHQEALTALQYLHATQRFNQQLELLRKFNQDMLKLRGVSARARAASVGTDTSTGRLNRPQSDVGAENIDNIVSAQEAVGVIREEEFQEALAAKEQQLKLAHLSDIQIKSELRQMQHAFDIETMDQEIELERMKIEAKKQINLEYVSWAGGLGQIFKNIAGDNEALAKTALILEKGSKIASIIIETTAANQKILAASSARAAAGDPTAASLGKIRIAKNKIGAGISIATILSTGLNSKGLKGGGPSGGGSGSGAPSREFDFNLVGSTRENQLAEGVAGQFGQPIQAYVVSSQITSQQQLDNTIQTQASLGD